MSSFLKSLFHAKKPKKQLAVAEPGKMFAWKAGCWLEATETTVFLLPGQLIRDGEKIGSIIEFSSDDVQIGFTESPDRKSITEIRLKLEAGQSRNGKWGECGARNGKFSMLRARTNPLTISRM